MADNQKLLMYFHTAFRNIGLYTTLSYGSLAYSRVFRGKNPTYNLLLIVISMGFICIAGTMNYLLYKDINLVITKDHKQYDSLVNYINIIYGVFAIHCILLLLTINTAIVTTVW